MFLGRRSPSEYLISTMVMVWRANNGLVAVGEEAALGHGRLNGGGGWHGVEGSQRICEEIGYSFVGWLRVSSSEYAIGIFDQW